MSKYRIENNSSTIEEIKTFIKEHLYKDSYDDDEPYFINVKLDKNEKDLEKSKISFRINLENC